MTAGYGDAIVIPLESFMLIAGDIVRLSGIDNSGNLQINDAPLKLHLVADETITAAKVRARMTQKEVASA